MDPIKLESGAKKKKMKEQVKEKESPFPQGSKVCATVVLFQLR